MNKLIRSLLFSASLATAMQAAPFVAIGDGAELFATGTLAIRGDDNIFLADKAVADTIFDIAPGLELDFGKNAQLQGALTLTDTWIRYADRHDLNTNLFVGDLIAKFDDGKTKYAFNAGYHELNQNNADIRGLIRRDISTIGGNGEFGVSELTSIGVGADYTHENYHPAGFVDSNAITIPVNVYYKITPKVDLSVGYRFRDFQVDNAGNTPDTRDNFYSVGARGTFTPKLTGRAAVGLTQRKFSTGGLSSRTMLGLDTSLAYELSPKSTVQVGATNAFDTSPTGAQQKNLVVNALFTTKVSEEWMVNVGASYRRISYYAPISRSDDYMEGNLGATYIINANIKLVGSYVYRGYRTGDDLIKRQIDFDNNVVSIAANFRY